MSRQALALAAHPISMHLQYDLFLAPRAARGVERVRRAISELEVLHALTSDVADRELRAARKRDVERARRARDLRLIEIDVAERHIIEDDLVLRIRADDRIVIIRLAKEIGRLTIAADERIAARAAPEAGLAGTAHERLPAGGTGKRDIARGRRSVENVDIAVIAIVKRAIHADHHIVRRISHHDRR